MSVSKIVRAPRDITHVFPQLNRDIYTMRHQHKPDCNCVLCSKIDTNFTRAGENNLTEVQRVWYRTRHGK